MRIILASTRPASPFLVPGRSQKKNLATTGPDGVKRRDGQEMRLRIWVIGRSCRRCRRPRCTRPRCQQCPPMAGVCEVVIALAGAAPQRFALRPSVSVSTRCSSVPRRAGSLAGIASRTKRSDPDVSVGPAMGQHTGGRQNLALQSIVTNLG